MSKGKEAVLVTKEGYDKLKKEYEDLTTNERPQIISELKRSRELGDLSENGAYHAAREKQAFTEGRIKELEDLFKQIEVVDRSKDGSVSLGSVVVVQVGGKQVKYTIVGEGESDFASGKIAHNSPVGKALVGKKEGDTTKVNAPSGVIEYKILKVE